MVREKQERVKNGEKNVCFRPRGKRGAVRAVVRRLRTLTGCSSAQNGKLPSNIPEKAIYFSTVPTRVNWTKGSSATREEP